MKLLIILALALMIAKVGTAAPLQLHNRIVFTRNPIVTDNIAGSYRDARNRAVWTMDAQGRDQKIVWSVPKGYGKFGGFSRDGKYALSFNSFNLYQHDMRTKRILKVLVWNGGWGTDIEMASFSPDGKEILCTVGDFSANRDHSYVYRIQAGKTYSKVNTRISSMNPSSLSTGEKPPKRNEWGEAQWNKRGNQIVAVSGISDVQVIYKVRDYGKEIWVMNRDWSGAKRLTNNEQADTMPSFSPDGRKIVFVRKPDSEYGDAGGYASNLWVYDFEQQAEKALTFYTYTYETWQKILEIQATNPHFSPDGKYIAFDQNGVYRIDADGKNLKRLSDGYLVQWIW